MFTGLVRELGSVSSLKSTGSGAVLAVKAGEIAKEAAIGDSIAVNGACLTVTEINGNALSFDLSAETLKSTTLGKLKPGERVNLEPSLTPSGKLGGHFVTGHVDAVGKIIRKTPEGATEKFEIEAPPEVMRFLIKKGSVAVDGISLTVVDVLKSSFTVVIIPHTSKMTTLGFKGAGDAVNLEADMLGKYVYKFLNKDSSSGDESLMKALKEGGFA